MRAPTNDNARIGVETEHHSPGGKVKIPLTKRTLKLEKEKELDNRLIDPENQNDGNNTNDVIDLEEDPLAIDVDFDSSNTLNMSALTTTTSSILTPGTETEEPIKIDLSSLFKKRKSQRTKVSKNSNLSKRDILLPKVSTDPNRSKRGQGKESLDSGVEIIIEDEEEISISPTKKSVPKKVQKKKAARLLARKTPRSKGRKSGDSGKDRGSDSSDEIEVISTTDTESVLLRKPSARKDKVSK